MPAHRVYELTEAEQEQAIDLASKCNSMSEISRRLGFKYPTEFENYRKRYPTFNERLVTARDYAIEERVFECLSLVDRYENPHQARVQFEINKWFASVMKPDLYGDKLNLTVTQTIDIAGAIERATQRAVIDVTPQIALDTPQNALDTPQNALDTPQNAASIEDLV